MPVPVHYEPAEFSSYEPENCSICRLPTRYWLTPHIPLCPGCADKQVSAEPFLRVPKASTDYIKSRVRFKLLFVTFKLKRSPFIVRGNDVVKMRGQWPTVTELEEGKKQICAMLLAKEEVTAEPDEIVITFYAPML